jgi:hypothetical protein
MLKISASKPFMDKLGGDISISEMTKTLQQAQESAYSLGSFFNYMTPLQ